MLLPHRLSRPNNTILTTVSPSNSSHLCGFQEHGPTFLTSPSKPISRFHSFSHAGAPITSVNVEKHEEEETICFAEWKGLKQKIDAVGIDCPSLTPGHYTYIICPKCKGGKSMARSLSFHVNQSTDFAMWRCFHFECGWAGQVFSDSRATNNAIRKISEMDLPRQLTEETLQLEPPGDEVIAYFSDRRISKEVLQRNGVMQTVNGEIVVAFTYRRQGQLVNCKYRSIISKKFWQEKGAERILYGLDGIKDSDEIIIVEGETDKLSMEEAGIFNSVSVPDGAPQNVSKKVLPSKEQDTKYKYLWNSMEYLDKASRIVLATDSDVPGQALAEELARRLGRERCWLVTWPKKDELGCFKDANDVLMNLGAGALRDIIESAQPYETQKSNETTEVRTSEPDL